MSMKRKFVEYWQCCTLPLAVAVALDPRFKMKGVEFFYAKIYREVESEPYVKRARDCLNDLYMNYVGLATSSDNGLNLSNSSSSVTSPTLLDFDRWCTATEVPKAELEPISLSWTYTWEKQS